MKAVQKLNAEIAKLEKRRNKALRTMRLRCQHKRLAEQHYSGGNAPRRVCMDCGAWERGWHCGYQVLATGDDIAYSTVERSLVRTNISEDEFYKLRWQHAGPDYPVGQSHPNFAKGGIPPYKELTEIKL